MDRTPAETTPDVNALLASQRAQAADRADDRAFGKACREAVHAICQDRTLIAFVDSVAFGEVSPIESFRRLELLRSLQPGVFCSDRTWGFGVIKRLDDFYKKLTVDFVGKPGHQMTYAYASESLTMVDDSHLLVRRHKDPAGLDTLIRERPDEIVRLALRNFGPMSVTKLEKTLTDAHIVTAAQWKTFWDGARKGLKRDPLVELPAKRAELITIRTHAQNYGDAWMAALGRERDIARILTLIGELETQMPDKIAGAAAVLSDRLAFALKGAYNTDPGTYARLAITVQRLGLATPEAGPLKAHLWEDNRFIKAAEQITAREASDLAGYLLRDDEPAQRQITAMLPRLPYNLACEVLQILYGGPVDGDAQRLCRDILRASAPHPVLLTWAIRNREAFANWNLPSLYDLLMQSISLLEEKRAYEALRMQNTIRLVFDHVKGFDAAFSAMDALQRQAMFERVQASPAWDPASHRRLLSHMIKIEPNLAARRKTSATAQAADLTRQTSWRSLADRQVAYRQLVEVALPKNSQEIATARSYGDLRENFEYQAAKHQQGLLLQRQAEMDNDLKQMKGTDFTGIHTDKAGMGVTVTLACPDASTRTYTILGEWDRDEALNIISCRSKLAQCLEGRRPGDRVLIPGEMDDELVTIAAVEPLSDAVRAWLAVVP
jgi:transcription elongation GreA/GreB family factor